MIEDVLFGELLPDQPNYKNPGLMRAVNVYATIEGYSPIFGPRALSQSVTGKVLGCKTFYTSDGTPVIFVGTSTDLFIIRGSAVYPSSLALSLTTGDFWVFDQFLGSVYAVCKTYGMYRLVDIEAGSTFVFSAVAPKASALNTVGDFLMAGDTTEGVNEFPYRIRWSSFNNPTVAWDEDTARQSGYVDMLSKFGKVMAIVGGTFDLVFQRNAISRIWYTGGSTVFNKEVVEDQRGTPAPKSLAQVGGSIYFLAADGFCRTNGAGSEVISSGKVWRWFRSVANLANIKNAQAAVDWSNQSVIWSFSSTGTTELNMQLIYNWATNRWTMAQIDIDWLVESSNVPLGIDDTDPSVVGDDTLDVIGPSFDSPQYEAQGKFLFGFIGGVLHEFSGPALRVVFETAEYQPQVGRLSFIRAVKPLIDTQGPTVTTEISGRLRPGIPIAYGPPQPQENLGFCPVASEAEFHTIRISIPAGEIWSKAQGIQVDLEITGAS